MCSSCGYLRPFLPPGEGQGEEYAPLSRHHVGNRACVAARPGKKTPQPTPHLLRGLAGGVSGSLTAMQVLAWLVRPCGFDACPSCVSSSLVHAAPWLAGPREAEGAQAAGEAGLDLSKEHLRTQELESCAPVADTFGLSFLREGVRGRSTPPVSPSRRKPGPALPLDLKEDTPSQPPHLLRGLAGVSPGR